MRSGEGPWRVRTDPDCSGHSCEEKSGHEGLFEGEGGRTGGIKGTKRYQNSKIRPPDKATGPSRAPEHFFQRPALALGGREGCYFLGCRPIDGGSAKRAKAKLMRAVGRSGPLGGGGR